MKFLFFLLTAVPLPLSSLFNAKSIVHIIINKKIGYSPFCDNASYAAFCRIFTVALLLFLAPAESSNLWGQLFDCTTFL